MSQKYSSLKRDATYSHDIFLNVLYVLKLCKVNALFYPADSCLTGHRCGRSWAHEKIRNVYKD